ncbi:pyridoxal phosphate-dependent aminotransferase [Paenibacillus sp. F411]|uniref:MalY/PatB family protein n=1 Tax=unclassified Paenibacillus TaxID=185978 RepID=UPI001AAFCFD0|nr:MalY/PatB family protein [Paenibacillus sp. F411]MBO2944028.1 pyridoxal phosphate-dependent aminotransferase [Paenibacillus sp. F411]
MNFDLNIDRTETSSLKWDHVHTIFGVTDALPLWVADMDFAAPPAVIQAMHDRVDHGVFGYTLPSQNYLEAVCGWMKSRHQWSIKPEWIQFCPGVVPALSMLVSSLTEPGDGVVIQTPVYPPFYRVVKDQGRELIENVLVQDEDGRYDIDFEDLERCLAAERTKMIILCSPHNPVGRVWKREELSRIAELCQQHDVLVVSDEIHADLVFEPGAHTPFAALSEDAAQRSIICTAPSKTFNIAGLNTANLIIPNDSLKRKFAKTLETFAMGAITPLGAAATEAAYREGGEWLDALLTYVRGNMEYVRDYIAEHTPEVKVWLPEATYLLWLDFRALGLPDKELSKFLVEDAKLGLNNGASFGTVGDGFMRMNVACTSATLQEAMRRLEEALSRRRTEAAGS